MLSWMRRLIETRERCRAVGRGCHRVLEVDDPAVFANRYEGGDEPNVVAVHDLADEPRTVTLPIEGFEPIFGDADFEPGPASDGTTVSPPAYGYCWLRGPESD